jgi:hypothetical protein
LRRLRSHLLHETADLPDYIDRVLLSTVSASYLHVLCYITYVIGTEARCYYLSLVSRLECDIAAADRRLAVFQEKVAALEISALKRFETINHLVIPNQLLD